MIRISVALTTAWSANAASRSAGSTAASRFHRARYGDAGYMQDLFTSSDARGRGVGATPVAAVYSKAAEAGSAGVYWHTHGDNRVAMALYDRVATNTGFVVYRRNW